MRMHEDSSLTNVIALPNAEFSDGPFDALDIFLMDRLTPAIGFELGTYALCLAGFEYVGDIVAATHERVAEVEGMTPWKIRRIEALLKRHDLWYGQDVGQWKERRTRLDGNSPGRQLGVRLGRHLQLVT